MSRAEFREIQPQIEQAYPINTNVKVFKVGTCRVDYLNTEEEMSIEDNDPDMKVRNHLCYQEGDRLIKRI